jgi:hypothetical protein
MGKKITRHTKECSRTVYVAIRMICVQLGKWKLNRSGLGQEKHYIFVVSKPFLILRRGKFAQDHGASSGNLGFVKCKRKNT